MLWDDEYFYIAAEMEEPHVWGTLTKHDSVIFHDNDFEVFIDPNGDTLEYYEFEINALNTGWDLILDKPYRHGGRASNAWEIPGLRTAVHVDGTLNDPSDTDRGWSVELSFPWKALAEYAHKPTPPRENDEWRVNFSRVEWQHEAVAGKYRKVPNTKRTTGGGLHKGSSTCMFRRSGVGCGFVSRLRTVRLLLSTCCGDGLDVGHRYRPR